jgi:hypothetical protein
MVKVFNKGVLRKLNDLNGKIQSKQWLERVDQIAH